MMFLIAVIMGPQLFITDRSKAVLMLWFTFIHFILIMSFMLHDFVAARL